MLLPYYLGHYFSLGRELCGRSPPICAPQVPDVKIRPATSTACRHQNRGDRPFRSSIAYHLRHISLVDHPMAGLGGLYTLKGGQRFH